MAHGKDQAGLSGQSDQLVGFFHRGGDGFFHQHMGAGGQEGAHDGRMGDGGRADRNQIHLAQKLAPIDNRQHAMLGDHGAAGLGAGIGDGVKLHAGNVAIFGAVMTAESSGANDGNLQRPLFRNTAAQKHSP